jgi:hypothetical protein
VFNAGIKDESLIGEAWLDPRRAEAVGEKAIAVCERARNKQPIEVSVGAFVVTSDRPGEYRGQSYARVWEELTQDHLAMLEEGVLGACSNEMGCGAPRVARVHLMTAQGITIEEKPMAAETKPVQKRSLRDRLAAILPTTIAAIPEVSDEQLSELYRLSTAMIAAATSEISDNDVRSALSGELANREGMSFLWIEAVFSDRVVYAVQSASGSATYLERSYTIEGNSVTLGDERKEVAPRLEFVELNAKPQAAKATTKGEQREACGCKKPQATTAEGSMDKAQRINALIENPNAPFDAEDRQMLEGATDARLEALATKYATPAKQADPVAPVAPVAPVQQPTAAATLSEEDRAALDFGKAQIAAAKATHIATLKASGRCDFPDAELSAMSVDQLARLAKLAAPDQSNVVAGVFPRAASTDAATAFAPAPTNGAYEQIRAANQAK